MIRNCQKLDDCLDIMETSFVLCVGDMMLDEYISGSASRLSPEAPVPVIRRTGSKQVLGGVGNVAANLAALGCRTAVFYAVGHDTEADQIHNMLQNKQIEAYPHAIGAITTKKQRVIAQKQQICRIDSEEPLILTKQQEDKIVHQVTGLMPKYNIIILSDYNKGFISPRVAQGIIQAANKNGKPVLVDPKGTNYQKYQGATLIKPNLNELRAAINGISPEATIPSEFNPEKKSDVMHIQSMANLLRQKLNIKQSVVTLGEYGMIGVSDSETLYLPTQAKSVSDVSGAGDTSLAVLAAALGADISLPIAIDLANIGAGIVVSKEGTATITTLELRKKIRELFHCESDPKGWFMPASTENTK